MAAFSSVFVASALWGRIAIAESNACADKVGQPMSASPLLLQVRAQMKVSKEPVDDMEGFHCDEAFEEWRRGWSWAKITWCCQMEGIACDGMAETVNVPATQGETMEGYLDLTNSIDVVVEADTSSVEYAESSTGASMAFRVGPHWTEELDLCANVEKGEVIARMVRLPAWPSQMRIKALGNDSWGYSSIFLYVTDRFNNTVKTTVLRSPLSDSHSGSTHGNHGSTHDSFHNSAHYANFSDIEYRVGSPFWVDLDGMAPKENVYNVAVLPEGTQDQQQCTTRDDPRSSSSLFNSVSPAGTPCVFGVDDADEGSHCIFDDGAYGSFGWCYTSKDGDSWGSCGETCPLYGPFKILGTKVDEVLRRLKRLDNANKQASRAPKAAATTTAGPATSAAPKAGAGNSSSTAKDAAGSNSH